MLVIGGSVKGHHGIANIIFIIIISTIFIIDSIDVVAFNIFVILLRYSLHCLHLLLSFFFVVLLQFVIPLYLCENIYFVY